MTEQNNQTNEQTNEIEPLNSQLFETKDAQAAKQAKTKGNELYGKQDYIQAKECYTQAIELSPPEQTTEMSIYYSNRAACYCVLNEWSNVLQDCTQSIQYDSNNLKAHLRRSQAHEKLGDVHSALLDQQRALEISPDDGLIQQNVVRLTKLDHEKMEHQKTEMLNKLKDLGNGILGKFGMSLDQFQANKDPSTGSYNIQFNQKQ